MPRRPPRTFGQIDLLPSSKPNAPRFRARYLADGKLWTIKPAGGAFVTRGDAERALAKIQSQLSAGTWTPPDRPAPVRESFREYADRWVTERRSSTGQPLAQTTVDLYRSLLRNWINPTFGDTAVSDLTGAMIRTWRSSCTAGPTAAANARGLLKAICATAVADGLLAVNPCAPRGERGFSTKTRAKEPATVTSGKELAALRAAMPAQHRSTIDLLFWGSLRIGEAIALRVGDLDLEARTITVRRSQTRTSVGAVVKAPKSRAGLRTVTLPSGPVIDALRAQVGDRAAGEWLFPSASDASRAVSADVVREAFEAARDKVGRPDLKMHDLRGAGATLAAAAGASVATLQRRLGHADPRTAMLYQRDGALQAAQELADGMAARFEP